MTNEEKQAHIEELFSDEVTFEKRVLDIQNETDRREVMGLLAAEIIGNELKSELHFSYLKSYDQLRTDGIVRVLLQRISTEAAGYLEERLRLTKTMTVQSIRQTPTLLFLKRLCLYYFKRYSALFFERSADTLFEKIAALASAANPPACLHDAVAGSPKRFGLIKGNAVSFEHVWNHARRASMERKKEMGKVQISLTSILKILETNDNLDDAQKRQLRERYDENRRKLETIRHQPLSHYDGSIRRMKQLVVESLQELATAD